MDTAEFFNSQLFAGVMALAGTVLGAIISAVIAVIVHKAAAKEARQAREEERREVEIAAARRLQIKLIQLLNNLATLRAHIRKSYDDCAKAGDPPEAAWKHLQSFANLPDRVSISPEEISLLSLLKNDLITNAAMLLDARHNAHVDGLRTYSELRREFAQAQNLAWFSNDNLLTRGRQATAEQRLQTHNLGQMVRAISNSIEKDVDDATKVLNAATEGFKQRFGNVFVAIREKQAQNQGASPGPNETASPAHAAS